MIFILSVLAVIAICIFGELCFLWRIHVTDDLFWVTRQFGHRNLNKVKCPICGGTGVQWLAGGMWRILPKHLRKDTKGREGWQIKCNQSNVRRCVNCHGLGFTWVTKAAVPQPAVPNADQEDQERRAA